MAKPPLGPILSATFVSPDPEAAARDYIAHLDQIVVDRRPVPEDLAQAWGAPAVAGRPMVLLRPRSAEPGWIRIIQGDPAPAAFTTFGWTAMEILVRSADVTSRRLKGTPFMEIGEPHDLGVVKGVRAMQAVGRTGEVLYLTNRDEVNRFRCRHVMGDVDRIFIMVLGAKDYDKARAFYQGNYTVSIGIDVTTAQGRINQAVGRPVDERRRMCTLVLAGGQEVAAKIQLDEHPPQASARPRRPGDLPGGVALVGFEVPSFAGLDQAFVKAPKAFDFPPYDGRLVASVTGGAGELIEIAARS
jgi:hypothetical protein